MSLEAQIRYGIALPLTDGLTCVLLVCSTVGLNATHGKYGRFRNGSDEALDSIDVTRVMKSSMMPPSISIAATTPADSGPLSLTGFSMLTSEPITF